MVGNLKLRKGGKTKKFIAVSFIVIAEIGYVTENEDFGSGWLCFLIF